MALEKPTPIRCPIMRRALDALRHWDAIRDDKDSNIHDTAGCAGMLAKALRDLVRLSEQRGFYGD